MASEEQRPDERRPEWALIEKLTLAGIEEQRRTRRWRIFFRFVFAGLLLLLVVQGRSHEWPPGGLETSGRFVAVVDLNGVINDQGSASADVVDRALRQAFAAHPVGVILRADSPGGSPVQSDEMYSQIMRLRARYPRIPIYGVVEDLCASGCYYVISATNKIYANPVSLVGSIGVLMDGFGFVDTMKKLGVTRRLYTAGVNKGFLDPFTPMTPAHRAFIQKLLDQTHQQFIARVEAGRGAVLDTKDPDLFTGLAWTGVRAKQLGLIDGFGGLRFVAHQLLHARRMVDFSPQRSLIDRFAKGLGTSAAHAVMGAWDGTTPRVE